MYLAFFVKGLCDDIFQEMLYAPQRKEGRMEVFRFCHRMRTVSVKVNIYRMM
jgi:hypothetical protein